jgi:hypothetical protein
MAYWPIDDAIAEIRRVGGAAVLAHPTTISTDRGVLRHAIRELTEIGLDGIEEGPEMGKGRGGMRFSADLLAPLKKCLSERQDQLLSL